MKEILIVDVDYWNNKHLCDSCPIWNDEKHFCQYDRNTGNKGCPLKPMPEKRENLGTAYSVAHTNGWNDCVDSIEENGIEQNIPG